MFGASVAILGTTVLVGSPGADETGAVYQFDLDSFVRSFSAPVGSAGFGTDVAMDGASLLVGAPTTNANEGSSFFASDRLFVSGFEP